ncbi:response regulator transcription factor [Nitrospina gracilis]|uniref:response regulator transcription factor n=1 Tax=Nitrospina gracilis TaxID=35801 RepID=UPI001F2E1532|nr:response regulator transcription factor [Nitrospina gracilis]MCF8720476.1 DNA-binding response OmpR family regulator [Nitrospina gracilis Nb-211]
MADNNKTKKGFRRYTILVVDDDPSIVTLVKQLVDQEKYKVISTDDGESAEAIIRSRCPDLVLLDINIPGKNGLEVCRSLRGDKETQNLPIIILSGRTEQVDRNLGLEFGADDYITKPFNSQELLLRVNNVLKRVYGSQARNDSLTHGVLTVDFGKHEVQVKNKTIQLTLTEFKLLSSLLDNLGQVKTRDYLMEHVWESGEGVFSRTIDTHIQRLRNKLEEAGQYIETIRGVGYRFKT